MQFAQTQCPFKGQGGSLKGQGINGQLETVETETGNGKWKRKMETIKT